MLNGEEYLYWYSVQGNRGIEVNDSTHEIDKIHLRYWNECIDPIFQPVDLETTVVMIPENIKQHMK
ncbi:MULTISPECIES: DUF6176 family protein [Bacillus]|uniref:DUF6176 family protein n=1 Tax=Bacillus TaxID=1386 RepID=UPI000BB81CD6|nr:MULTISPECIES: DUF6176 family protein [Bacillus]